MSEIITSMMTLSTRHLSKKTLDVLDELFIVEKMRHDTSDAATTLERSGINVSFKTEIIKEYDKKPLSVAIIGYYISVPTPSDGKDTTLPDLQEAINYARQHNCALIDFDRDVEPINELKDWYGKD